jgi:catechol 2,3-dioxygenase-like lactoylglutathione lyase family enzyme
MPFDQLGLEFHHVGVACANLKVETAVFRTLGYAPDGQDFVDPAHGVRGRFLVGGGPRLELLVPLPESGVLQPWTSRGIRMYHMAYETASLTDDLRRLRDDRARLVSPPTPAVAFGGRPVAFVVLPTLQLIELIGAG